ncbi:MAG: hypothetical protein KIT87_09480 [Anaerolineae bacterium]|nr:hypothetical protein [Anaerolineae bacterium]
MADFTRTIQLDPNNVDYYWERGKSYYYERQL